MNDAMEPMAPSLQPITLTPQEYQELVDALAQRDPLVRFLMSRQAEAQRAALAQQSGGLRSPAYDYAFGHKG
jgi:hypothetical protein